jgi:probable rRNA maturation factor
VTASRSKAAAVATAEIVIESTLWAREPESEGTLQRAVQAAAEQSTTGGALAILLTDDSHMRTLNRDFRGIDKATNVLSFPTSAGAAQAKEVQLGDVAIAFETVAAEAATEGKTFQNHLAHLGVHGFLHLIGFDHETDGEAEEMEARERAILAHLGIPDPYAENDDA